MRTSAGNADYELDVSPRSSFSDVDLESSVQPRQPQTPPVPPPAPSIKLLFSLLSRSSVICLLLPAVLTSIIAGGVAPFMTYVIGQSFDAFAHFSSIQTVTQQDKDRLLHDVGKAALELLALGVGALALASITSSLWIWTAERNAKALRRALYRSMEKKDMFWFDTHFGEQDAGGIMAKFTRETDDVRMATSLASGYLVQYLTTTIACLILAFIGSWALTLVILSAVPLLTLIQAFSQRIAAPLLFHERLQTSLAATLVSRVLSSITTVKAYNAQPYELSRAASSFETLRLASRRLNKVWGTTSGMSQFVMMGMFVQGFWFGGKLVRDGKASSGDVMAVFWACLIATSNLQMCIPQFIILAKGKFSMAALMEIIHDSSSSSDSSSPLTRPPTSSSFTVLPHGKITPSKLYGEISIRNISFSYPSKPSHPVLENVSIYIPAHEFTFIVGSSGSGKSTIASLLMGLYQPSEGQILLDDRDFKVFDEAWLRSVLGAVSQSGMVILDGKSVWENVAVGIYGRPGGITVVTDEEVKGACRMALVHEFVKDLPEGYDTILGSSSTDGEEEDDKGTGVMLSGGQKQRLEIARARIRDPEILILDEATSALDGPSRVLVFSAIRHWRRDKTTIVITHELAQIEREDFVYVLKSGKVVEQGYRRDLERVPLTSKTVEEGEGEFRRMLEIQRGMSGEKEKCAAFEDEEYYEYDRPANPTPPAYSSDIEDEDVIHDSADDHEHAYEFEIDPMRPLTFSNWMFDVVADLLPRPYPPHHSFHNTHKPSNPFSPTTIYEADEVEVVQSPKRHSTPLVTLTIPRPATIVNTPRRMSYPFSPNSPTLTCFSQGGDEKENWAQSKDSLYGSYYGYDLPEHYFNEESEGGDHENEVVSNAGRVAVNLRRMARKSKRLSQSVAIQVAKLGDEVRDKKCAGGLGHPGFFSTLIKAYPSIPAKPLLIVGLFICLASGAMTPVFSVLLSSLLYQVSIGAKDATTLNVYGGIVLGVAALDGLLLGLKYFVMEQVGMMWTTKLRNLALEKVLGQDKSWFDLAGSSSTQPSRSSSLSSSPSSTTSSPAEGSHDIPHIIQKIVKDGDDARSFISVILAQTIVVLTLLFVGIIWALCRGWELTLMGLAILPVFATTMAIQTRLISKCERKNKTAREEISKVWYEVLKNVKGIRYMGIERVFKEKFDCAVDVAEDRGMRGGWVEGASYGVASSLIYLAEAVLFYVGAVLIANGRYTYLKMVEVLNLVVFTVTIGSQLMAFTQKIAKSTQASHDLMILTNLSTSNTSESKGILKPSQSVLSSGPVSFRNISFAYPSNPNSLTLKSFDLTIQPGQCVAVVGASGSGKSTVAALLQRLYEPLEGKIRFGDFDVCDVDVGVLRRGMGVVEQSVKVFEDKSVEENILYGQMDVDEARKSQVVQHAAKLANIDWISPDEGDGFKAILGEVSGGQAQRIGVARALARSNDVANDGIHLLILDECTSALDVENQKQVMEAINNIRRAQHHENLKMVVVTHKVEVMRMCDRLVVIKDGQVAEDGNYEELMEKKGGVFRDLARGGVWES